MRKRPVISQLEKHYARITGELKRLHEEVVAAGISGEALAAAWVPEVQQRRDMLTHIEACLRLFEPDWTAAHIQPRRARVRRSPLEHKELLNRAYDVLREATAPMSSRELLEAMGRAGHLTIPESRRPELRSALTTLLRGQESWNAVRSHGRRPLRWSIVRATPRTQAWSSQPTRHP